LTISRVASPAELPSDVYKIPKEKERLYENIRKIAKMPFRASPWNFGNNWLGVDNSCLAGVYKLSEGKRDKYFISQGFTG